MHLLITPVLGAPPVAIGGLSPLKAPHELRQTLQGYEACTPVENAAGAPAICLPMGSSKDGLPRRRPPVWAG